jgi:hypothetical protein
MQLRDIAHVRTGDKGDTAQISLIAFDPRHYAALELAITCERIATHLPKLPFRSIQRFELPGLGALNFVLEGALYGGVTRSLSLDAHGKTIGAQLLDMDLGDVSDLTLECGNDD